MRTETNREWSRARPGTANVKVVIQFNVQSLDTKQTHSAENTFTAEVDLDQCDPEVLAMHLREWTEGAVFDAMLDVSPPEIQALHRVTENPQKGDA